MKFLEHLRPEWVLRITLGLTYLYSGIDLFRHPTAWLWALPYWLREFLSQFVDINLYLRSQGALEIVFAVVLLAWFLSPRLTRGVALLATIEFTVILVLAFTPWSEANFLITFRDIGLLGTSLALYLILKEEEKLSFRIR